jgi:catechol 2,3-dioxygenase-like lactoylglutathione lyase family enzyme
MSSEPIFVEAAMPTFSRALHMALTVRDMRVSADWYERVLGFDFVKEFEADPGDAGIPRILLLHQHSGFLPGLGNLRAERAMPSIRGGRAWITSP